MSARKMILDEFMGEQTEDQSQPQTPEAVGAEGGEATGTQTPISKNAKSRANQPFDPAQYLSNFDGREYLEVKWRLLWLRSEHPDARMTTEIVQHNEEGGFALFRAEVEIPGGGKATGWGSETVRDFHDYIEAAETKALGRALAALGYGTQFCQDFEFASVARPGTLQVVDAPVNIAEPRNVVNRASSFVNSGNGNGNASRQASFASSGFKGASRNDGGRMPAQEDDFDRLPGVQASGNSLATEKQLKAIYAIGRASKRLSEDQVDDRCAEIFGVKPSELTKAEASQFIDILKGDVAA